jgi:hypothetical protein
MPASGAGPPAGRVTHGLPEAQGRRPSFPRGRSSTTSIELGVHHAIARMKHARHGRCYLDVDAKLDVSRHSVFQSDVVQALVKSTVEARAGFDVSLNI